MSKRFRAGASAKMAVAVATAAVLCTAACSSSTSTAKPGSSSSSSSGGSPSTGGSIATPTADPALVALVPDAFKTKGALDFATDATYAPNEFTDADGKIVGFDVDLGTAVAAKLGLKAQFTNVPFSNILLGIQGGKYDLGMSSFTDSKEREQQGFDMVTYFTAGTKLMVAKGNPQNLSPDDNSLCGKTVGVETGTVQETDDIPARNKNCAAAGKPAIKPLSQEKQTDVNSSLQSNRSDAVLADSPVVDYYANIGPFQAAGASYSSAPYGIAIDKKNNALAQAVLGAIKALQADGTYDQLTTKWGIESGRYTSVGINQASS